MTLAPSSGTQRGYVPGTTHLLDIINGLAAGPRDLIARNCEHIHRT